MSNVVMGPEQEPVDPDWLIEWSMKYNRGGLNSQYIYNFRSDSEEEECLCGDSATWPTVSGNVRFIGTTTRVDNYDEAGVMVGSSYVELL